MILNPKEILFLSVVGVSTKSFCRFFVLSLKFWLFWGFFGIGCSGFGCNFERGLFR
jgi:hypothetical protein